MRYLQNRKARLAAGVAGAIMAFGVASPAFAQTVVATGGDDAVAVNAGFYDASQSVSVDAFQGGDARAVADDDSTAEAYNDLSIDVAQYNGGFGYGYADYVYDGDDDDDGIFDEYDYVILAGDYDNDGFVDYWE